MVRLRLFTGPLRLLSLLAGRLNRWTRTVAATVRLPLVATGRTTLMHPGTDSHLEVRPPLQVDAHSVTSMHCSRAQLLQCPVKLVWSAHDYHVEAAV